jgi:hypothetical protein
MGKNTQENSGFKQYREENNNEGQITFLSNTYDHR